MPTTTRSKRARLRDVEGRLPELVDLQPVLDNLSALASDQAAHETLEAELRRELASAAAGLDETTAQLNAAEAAYSTAYESDATRRFAAGHPLVRRTIEEGRCAVCGTAGDYIATKVANELQNQRCPLCAAELGRVKQPSSPRLRTLADEVSARAAAKRAASQRVERLQGELSEAARNASRAKEAYDQAVSAAGVDPGAVSTNRPVDELRRSYESQIAEALTSKNRYYSARDDKRRDLRLLQHELASHYREVETGFVPLFRDLAEEFMGVGVDIQLNLPRPGHSVSFDVDVENVLRSSSHQLSESQRFFLDIALRMALAQALSTPGSKPTMIIDTPEGSLDITYEKRVGEMFAKFVERGATLIMTANINASQLLIRLAERCGRDSMQLVRMLDWGVLSDVQRESEELFEEALARIELSLEMAGR